MQETIFKPKYQPRSYRGFFIIPPLEAYVIWSVFSSPDKRAGMIFIAVFFGLLLLLIPFVFIKRIRFESYSFTIEKYFLPSKTIDYSDVLDIGNIVIRTKRGSISLLSMENSNELTDLLKKLIPEGKISPYQIENKLFRQLALGRKAVIPSGIITAIFWFITLFLFPYEKPLFREMSIVLILIPTYLLIYLFMKKRADNQ